MRHALMTTRSHASWRNGSERRLSQWSIRLLQAMAALIALALTGFTPATFDCGSAYKEISRRVLERHGADPNQLAHFSRKALRLYDACVTGDVDDAPALFARFRTSLGIPLGSADS
jgi:hypothetical protein